MQARAVLFDLDGTLVNSLPGIEFSVDCALEECGSPERRQDLRALIGPPIRNILAKLVPHAGDAELSRLESVFRQSYDSVGWRKSVLYEQARETLAALKYAGVPLFLVTNKPAAPTRRILEHVGILDLFTEILCPDSKDPCFPSKPAMLKEIVERHSLDSATCLYVGDTAEDYRAATECGIPIALVAHGYGAESSGNDFPAGLHLNNLSELLNLVAVMEMS